eukprot:TRINITY_DN3146_c0_g2_i1.p2 TRINITY_DN3146_c0_g2~~TRINITY_DN3146_c0_g2_i1.p2  ORF type:complete len:149 (+),score=52.79 TRINITY_DN3146_c0_g2_i1:58-504(+)
MSTAPVLTGPTSGGSAPPLGPQAVVDMQMWFYQSTSSTVLFQSWTTTSLGSYIVACVLCALAACLMMVVKQFMGTISDRHLALQAVVAFLYFNLAYAVMLVAMTFNIGLYLACMVGMTAGFVITKVYTRRTAKGEGQALLSADVDTCH